MEAVNAIKTFYGHVRPVLDVAILAWLIYKLFQLLEKTNALQMLKGAGFLALIFAVSQLFQLTTLQWILRMLAPGLVIAVAIVFQPELRKIITRLGQGDFFGVEKTTGQAQIEAVITASEILSEQRRGALIVFPRRTNIKDIIDTGTRIDAVISSSIIATIFEFDTHLHDGAMVIQAGRIVAAGCFLPLSEQQDIKKTFGTRHRAALGMSERSDAVVLVVSEETGALSIAFEGQLYYALSLAEIQQKLAALVDKDTRPAATGEMNDISDHAAAALDQGQSTAKTNEVSFFD